MVILISCYSHPTEFNRPESSFSDRFLAVLHYADTVSLSAEPG